MSDNIKRVYKIIFLAVVAILSYIYISRHIEQFKKILSITYTEFIILSAIAFVGIFLKGMLLKEMVRFYNVGISAKEGTFLSILRSYTNYILFRGGPLSTGFYLKRLHGLSYTSFFNLLIFTILLETFWASVLMVISIFLIFVFGGIFDPGVFSIALTILILTVAFFLLSDKILGFITVRFKKDSEIAGQWLRMKKDYGFIGRLSVWTLLFLVFSGLSIFFAYRFTSRDVSFSLAMLLAGVTSLSTFIALTPASLGVREALMGFAGKMMGASLTATVIAASLNRLINMIWILGLGFALSIWYSKRL